MSNPLTPEELARRFHETYERLAPTFGYKTRPESAVAWEDVPEPNRALMVAVAGEVMGAQVAAAEQEVAALRELVQGLLPHVDIAVNSSEWYGPDDRIRAEALIEAAKAHLRGDVADPPAGGAS